MLEIQKIIENKSTVIAGLIKKMVKNPDQLVDQVIKTNDLRKSTQKKLDDLLSELNGAAKQIGSLMKEGKKEAAEKIKQKTAEIKEQTTLLKQELSSLEAKVQTYLYELPNVPHESVPEGKADADNEVVYIVPNIEKHKLNGRPHWELIDQYRLIDFELGNKITGAGFPVYLGKGARLQRALINFFLDEATKAGYEEVTPPILVNEASGYATGQLPDKEGQMYEISKDQLFVIPTGEVPITNIYRNEIIKEDVLPIKNVGYTPCFRREAGSWGADVRGLNRLHQFDKVEIVQITHPKESYTVLEEMKKHIEGLLNKLELPYRILNLCGGDISFTSALTFDFEVYSAGQDRWLEVSSVSNFETYQANRLKLRYKDVDKKSHLLHTLNGSALALPRIMAALLENNQSEKGITIPQALVPYTGFDVIN